MSTDGDLSSAFGRPARNLSTLMSPNPRRSRREEPTDPADDEVSTEDPRSDDAADIDVEGRRPTPTAAKPDTVDRRDDPRDPAVSPAATRALTTAPDADQDAKEAQGRSTPSSLDSARGSAAATSSSPSVDRVVSPARAGGARRRSTGTRTKSGSTRAASSLDPDTSYQVGVYVHPHTRHAAVQRRKIDKVTNAEIVFDAIDAVQHRLDGLLRDRRTQVRPDSSLFPGRVRRGRLAAGPAGQSDGDTRRVLWQFRASGAELEVIDRLVEHNGAESRSELVAVALEATLFS